MGRDREVSRGHKKIFGTFLYCKKFMASLLKFRLIGASNQKLGRLAGFLQGKVAINFLQYKNDLLRHIHAYLPILKDQVF